MSNVAILVENLSKRYRIGQREPYYALRDVLARAVMAPFQGLRSILNGRRSDVSGQPSSLSAQRSAPSDTIWALKDASFEVKQGEVVGIIGRNGAGKSTLLKILSRVTRPTTGRAELYGRVGSLLEVGTGFHPELTGRENIYLSGAILGMKKAEIDRKFDGIIAFAEMEKFIDTPVKYYSSGMFVRLAFAVAAHLDTEILIVDEVLAVGDAMFQEKCMGAMQNRAASGRTILFVSHNMAAIQHLCSRAILLKSGQVSADGHPQEIVRSYLSEFSHVEAQESSSVSLREWSDRVTNGQARIVHFEITNETGQLTNIIPVGGKVRFSIFAEFYEPFVDPCFGIAVHDAAGKPILDLRSIHAGLRIGRAKGNVAVQVSVDSLGLYPGEYFLSPWIADSTSSTVCLDWAKFGCKLRVDPAPGPHGDLKLDPEWGSYWVQSNWSHTVNGMPHENPVS